MSGNKHQGKVYPLVRAVLTPQLGGSSEPVRAGSIWAGNAVSFLEMTSGIPSELRLFPGRIVRRETWM